MYLHVGMYLHPQEQISVTGTCISCWQHYIYHTFFHPILQSVNSVWDPKSEFITLLLVGHVFGLFYQDVRIKVSNQFSYDTSRCQ